MPLFVVIFAPIKMVLAVTAIAPTPVLVLIIALIVAVSTPVTSRPPDNAKAEPLKVKVCAVPPPLSKTIILFTEANGKTVSPATIPVKVMFVPSLLTAIFSVVEFWD